MMRRRHKRLATTITVAVAIVAVAVTIATTGGNTSHDGSNTRADVTGKTSTTSTPASTTSTVPVGALPQTEAMPSATSPQFLTNMQALWSGITKNSAVLAQPAFFPEGAYLQVKTLPADAVDYQERLVGQYALDIGAAHSLLGSDAPTATFVSVIIPSGNVHWVTPNSCQNQIGYYEVGNARLVYNAGGATQSIGIASMISWRGQWYVVHFGAYNRTTDVGMVLDPEEGDGTSTPASLC